MVQQKLQKSNLRLDSLFTGIDCQHAAMMQLSAACRRRKLDQCFQCPLFLFQCVLLVCLLFVDLFDLFFDCFSLLFVCVLAKQRYGFDMDWATGRACDIDKNSRKLLGFIQQLFCLWLLLLEPLVLICLLAPFAKLCLEKHHQVLGGAISQSMHLQQHPGLCEEPSCCNEQDEVGDLDLTSEPILLEHQFF